MGESPFGKGKKFSEFDSGGGDSGLATLIGYILGQNKSQELKGELGSGAIPVGGTSQAGVQYKTQQGENLEVSTKLRQKASEDAAKLQKSLPILDDIERSYMEAYKNYSGATSGLKGGLGAAGEYATGVVGRQNPSLRIFMDKLSQYEAPLIQLTGDVGNFSGSERQSIRAGFPKVTPNLDISRLFLPDDPEYGLRKVQELKRIYGSKYAESLNVAQTGQLSSGYAEWADINFGGTRTQNSPIPGAPNFKSQSNPSGKIRVKSRATGKTGDVSERFFDPKKYDRI